MTIDQAELETELGVRIHDDEIKTQRRAIVVYDEPQKATINNVEWSFTTVSLHWENGRFERAFFTTTGQQSSLQAAGVSGMPEAYRHLTALPALGTTSSDDDAQGATAGGRVYPKMVLGLIINAIQEQARTGDALLAGLVLAFAHAAELGGFGVSWLDPGTVAGRLLVGVKRTVDQFAGMPQAFVTEDRVRAMLKEESDLELATMLELAS